MLSRRRLLCLLPLAAVPALMPRVEAQETLRGPARWEKEIQAFEAQDRQSPPPTDAALFIGSSSIRGWKTLRADFPEIPVINRGFGGSQIADSTHFVERIVLPYKPRLIVMYAGTNDIAAGKPPSRVFADFQAFVAKVRAGLPDVSIAFISANPNIRRWDKEPQMRELNRLVAEWAGTQKRVAFLNSHDAFLGPDGMPQKALLAADNLHLSPEGYKVWVATLKPQILKLYEAAK